MSAFLAKESHPTRAIPNQARNNNPSFRDTLSQSPFYIRSHTSGLSSGPSQWANRTTPASTPVFRKAPHLIEAHFEPDELNLTVGSGTAGPSKALPSHHQSYAPPAPTPSVSRRFETSILFNEHQKWFPGTGELREDPIEERLAGSNAPALDLSKSRGPIKKKNGMKTKVTCRESASR
jgi:hypothetical protein